MPAHSRTRTHRTTGDDTGTGAAGRSSTTPGRLLALDWVRDGALDAGTRKKLFFASSTPLAIAAGHLLGLAVTDADHAVTVAHDTGRLKLKRRPPLTTLATRLIVTTRSM
jgi:hypothetical protein